MNKIADKIFIGLMSLGYLAASFILIGIAFGWTDPLMFLHGYLLKYVNSWLIGITGAVTFLVALSLLVSVFYVKPVKDTMVHQTSMGAIRITLPALENLVAKAAKSVHGVRDVKINLKLQQDSVAIMIKAQILPDLNIPAITEEMQKKVKEYIAKTAAIDVLDVRVIVNKISWEVKSRVE